MESRKVRRGVGRGEGAVVAGGAGGVGGTVGAGGVEGAGGAGAGAGARERAGDNNEEKQSESTGRMEQGRIVIVVSSRTDQQEEGEEADDASKKSENEKSISLASNWNGAVGQGVATHTGGEQPEDGGEANKSAVDEIFGKPNDRSPAEDKYSRKFEKAGEISLTDLSDEEIIERALEEELQLKRDSEFIST